MTRSTRRRSTHTGALVRPAHRRPPGPHARDDGSVTAEAAMVLPVLLAVLAMGVWVLAVVSAQLRCTDGAGVGARAAARGDDRAAVLAVAAAEAPDGAVVVVRGGTDTVEVEVRAEVRPFGPVLSGLGAVEVRGHAAAAREDRVGQP